MQLCINYFTLITRIISILKVRKKYHHLTYYPKIQAFSMQCFNFFFDKILSSYFSISASEKVLGMFCNKYMRLEISSLLLGRILIGINFFLRFGIFISQDNIEITLFFIYYEYTLL